MYISMNGRGEYNAKYTVGRSRACILMYARVSSRARTRCIVHVICVIVGVTSILCVSSITFARPRVGKRNLSLSFSVRTCFRSWSIAQLTRLVRHWGDIFTVHFEVQTPRHLVSLSATSIVLPRHRVDCTFDDVKIVSFTRSLSGSIQSAAFNAARRAFIPGAENCSASLDERGSSGPMPLN